jgi:hypothetical protein
VDTVLLSLSHISRVCKFLWEIWRSDSGRQRHASLYACKWCGQVMKDSSSIRPESVTVTKFLGNPLQMPTYIFPFDDNHWWNETVNRIWEYMGVHCLTSLLGKHFLVFLLVSLWEYFEPVEVCHFLFTETCILFHLMSQNWRKTWHRESISNPHAYNLKILVTRCFFILLEYGFPSFIP